MQLKFRGSFCIACEQLSNPAVDKTGTNVQS